MKNKEKYAKEIVEVAIGGHHIAFDKTINKVVPCNSIRCADCLFHSEKSCQVTGEVWANAEYEEPKQFTDREIEFVKLFSEIKYLARDYDGRLFAYRQKPFKDEEQGLWTCYDADMYEVRLGDSLKLESIRWDDEEPTSREEILRGSNE